MLKFLLKFAAKPGIQPIALRAAKEINHLFFKSGVVQSQIGVRSIEVRH